MAAPPVATPPATRSPIARLRDAASTHRWAILTVGVLGAAAVWGGLRLLAGAEVPVDRAIRGELVETVVASGHIESPYRVEIGSQITGTVAEVPALEGSTVIQGQVLVRLEAHELAAALEQAQAALAPAETRLREIAEVTEPTARASLAEAQATLLNAQQTIARTALLARSGDATRVALDLAQKDVDIAQTQVRAATLQVTTVQPGGSAHVMAVSQRDQARSSRDTAASRLGYATIIAPRDGVLITRNVEEGSVVQAGKALLVLAPAGESQIVLLIDERNIGKLALQAPAIVSADAYPAQRFDAVLTYINPGVDLSRAAVEVKLTIPSPPAYLRQDMTVSVDIETARHKDVITLPSHSVRDALSEAPWVLGFRDGRAARLPVRLGLHSATRIEITAGIDAGEPLIPATATTAAGDRARPLP